MPKFYPGFLAVDPIEQLVSRLYLDVLGRSYDTTGLQFWAGQLRSGSRTGSNVAHEFFFSEEYTGKRVLNGPFIDTLYKALMGRNPEPEGRAFWLSRLESGWPREDIFAGFVNSPEFDGFCRQAGIIRGTYNAPPGAMARVFAKRLYTTTLQREPDSEGLNHWHNSLKNGMTGAQAAYHFIFSPEMTNRNLNDERFVEVLYNALMGRSSDMTGRNFWVGQLRSGSSRYSVFVGFIYSNEFGLICGEHGIQRGHPPPPANLMTGTTMVNKVWNLIILAGFRGISDRPEHIAGIIGNLQSEAGSALCPFQQEVGGTKAGIGLMQWSFGRRVLLEEYMWRNEISQEDFTAEMSKHLTGVCSNPVSLHPNELLDKVLAVQINYMFHEFRNTSERLYLNYVDFPTEKTGAAGARAYAELFCSISLRPGLGRSNGADDILDEGVQEALQASPYSGGAGKLDRISYSGLETRRNRAANVYQQFLTNSR